MATTYQDILALFQESDRKFQQLFQTRRPAPIRRELLSKSPWREAEWRQGRRLFYITLLDRLFDLAGIVAVPGGGAVFIVVDLLG